MSETAARSAMLETEHTRIIGELIGTAVAPPLGQFQKATSESITQSATKIADATKRVVTRTEAVAEDIRKGFEEYTTRVRTSADEMAVAIQQLGKDIDGAVARGMAAPVTTLQREIGGCTRLVGETKQQIEQARGQIEKTDKHVEQARHQIEQTSKQVEQARHQIDQARKHSDESLHAAWKSLGQKLDANTTLLQSTIAESTKTLDNGLRYVAGQLNKISAAITDEVSIARREHAELRVQNRRLMVAALVIGLVLALLIIGTRS